jgi:H+/Cl- antiporter ClcA
MLRLILIILPLFGPLLAYMLYRWVRYGRNMAENPPPPWPVQKLLLLGLILVLANIIFLVRFEGTSAAATGYHYPEFTPHAQTP